MAILENETQNYYRIEVKHSFVQNNMVYANIIVYATENDRNREKERLPEFEAFDQNSRNMLAALNRNEQNAEICEEFAKVVTLISRMRYVKGESKGETEDLKFTLNSSISSLITDCGFKNEWISSPIRIIAAKIINCGEYNGEELTEKYIYDKLKSKMSSNVVNI